ncbi:hypothetical protein L598_002900000420 [Mesorhizobium sp. J18]|nr:hypothetical protein L598_005700000020 [Mesorhizobium sp. J18]TWG95018.1 hypothetical protein L598_003000000020 [Mesorhizobium sp. J18]TWG95904.1 hypothetical protein L598_002900000420 [Mesorhizobium sp. J18]
MDCGRGMPKIKDHHFVSVYVLLPCVEFLDDLLGCSDHGLGVPHFDDLLLPVGVGIGFSLFGRRHDEGFALRHAHHRMRIGPGLTLRLTFVIGGHHAGTDDDIRLVEHGRGPEFGTIKRNRGFEVFVGQMRREGERKAKMRGKLGRIA